MVAWLLLAACVKDDGPDDSGAGDPDPAVPPSPVTLAPDEPPATDVAAVQPIVNDLLDRYDELVEEIVTDPSTVGDREGALAGDFLDLFEPGSEFAELSLDEWAEWSDTGLSLQPVEEGTAINLTTIEGIVTPVSEDEVNFVKCTRQNYVRYDDGEEVVRIEDEVLAGEGTAVRVDGRWHLGVLTTPAGMLGCGIGR